MGFFGATIFNIFLSISVYSSFFLSMTIGLPKADPGVPLPTEEVFTELHQKFERQLDATLEQKEFLSTDTVTVLLRGVAFLKDDNIQIVDIQPRLPRKPRQIFQPVPSPQRILNATLAATQQQNRTSESDLFIVRSNNESVGMKLSERMYYDSLSHALFLQYEKPFERRSAFSQRMFLTAMRADYTAEVRALSGKKMPKKMKKKQRALLDAEFRDRMNHPKSLSAIPYGILYRHSREILNDFSRYRAEKRVSEIIAQANIPYGAFCWFYEYRLGKKGYEGPSVSELFSSSLYGRALRHTGNPAYALIEPYLDGVEIGDALKRSAFSEEILKEFDILSVPDEHLMNGSNEQRLRYWKHRAFFFFFREYLGKVYNGLCGNTPDGVTLRIRHELGQLGLPNKDRRLDTIFHEPLGEERVLFSRMKWHGTSLL